MSHVRFSIKQNICIWSVLIVSCFLFGCGRPGNDKIGVSLIQNDHSIDMANDRVRLLLSFDSSVVKQNYFAKKDGEWKLVAESFSGSAKTGSKVIPLYKKGPDVDEEHRLMANEGFQNAKVIENDDGAVKVILSGEIKGNKVEQSIELRRDQDYFHIEVNAN